MENAEIPQPKTEREPAADMCGMMYDAANLILRERGVKGGSWRRELLATLARRPLFSGEEPHVSITREVSLPELNAPVTVTLEKKKIGRKHDYVEIIIPGLSEVLHVDNNGGMRYKVDEETGDLEEIGEPDLTTAKYYSKLLAAFPEE